MLVICPSTFHIPSEAKPSHQLRVMGELEMKDHGVTQLFIEKKGREREGRGGDGRMAAAVARVPLKQAAVILRSDSTQKRRRC